MAVGLINDSTLTSIAAAIREKNQATTTYKPSEMADAIKAISSGGGFTGITAVPTISTPSQGSLWLNVGTDKNSSWFKAPNEIIVTAARVSTSPYSCTFDLSPYIEDNTPFLFVVPIDYGSVRGSEAYYASLFTRGLFVDANGQPLCSISNNGPYRSDSLGSSVPTGQKFQLTDLYAILPSSFTDDYCGTQGYVSYNNKVLTFNKQTNSSVDDRYPTGPVGSLLILGG